MSWFIVLTVILMGVAEMTLGSVAWESVLPESVEGWQKAGDDQFYHQENLHQYIDGGAELYLSFGYKKSFTRTYGGAGLPDLIVDIFDMQNSFNAFGVFIHHREIIDSTFGQGSQYSPGMLLFWKDHYYISILASPESDQSKNAMLALAKKIDTAIQTEGPLPEIIQHLPKDGLVEESIRFFYHPIWQNTYYFIADRNIFNIGRDTPAVLAKYGPPSQRMILLLICYADSAEAEEGLNQFKREYLAEPEEGGWVQTENGNWSGAELTANYLALIFNAASAQQGQPLFQKLKRNLVQR